MSEFPVIVIDPPWDFKTYSEAGRGRNADNHYPTQHLKWIAEIPVKDVAAPSCALFMWTTSPFMVHMPQILESWGFEYSTVAFVWLKMNKYPWISMLGTLDDVIARIKRTGAGSLWKLGNGYCTRANAEFCVYARRGMPKRRDAGVYQIIIEEIREHSRKPEQQYERIQRLFAGPYLEIFARETRPGWTAIGNEIDGLDIHESIRLLKEGEL